MIGIRADANREIGTGHIMRCLSVATALKECGQEICFVLADEDATELLRSRGMQYVVLDTDYRDMEAELPKLGKWLLQEQPQCILIDSYFVTEKYLREVKKYTRTAYMDDLNAFSYPVDLLINYNIYGDLLPYREQAADAGMQFLLGTDYVPLRKEFQNVTYELRPEVKNVLITTGGSDKYNLAGQLLDTLLQDKMTRQLTYHVISGAFNVNLPYLQGLAENHKNISIHQNVTNMSELMQGCDVALTAGGSTMYELSAIGIPIICFSFVENQEQIVRTYFDRGIVCFGGNYLTERDAMLDGVREHLLHLAESFTERRKYSEREKQLVDGLGAVRIAEAIKGTKNETN